MRTGRLRGSEPPKGHALSAARPPELCVGSTRQPHIAKWPRYGLVSRSNGNNPPLHLGQVLVLSGFMGPGTGALQRRQNTSTDLASVEQKFGRLVRRGRKTQCGICRHAGWVARLTLTANDFCHFAEPRLTVSRWGGAQVIDALGRLSRCVWSQTDPQPPFVALFSISRLLTAERLNLIIPSDPRRPARASRPGDNACPWGGLHGISRYPSAPWVQVLIISSRKDEISDRQGGVTRGVKGTVSWPATGRFTACPWQLFIGHGRDDLRSR